MMSMGRLEKWKLAEDAEVLGDNLAQCITVLFTHGDVATRRTSLLTALLVVIGVGYQIYIPYFFHTPSSVFEHRVIVKPRRIYLEPEWYADEIGTMIKVRIWGSLQGLTGLAPTTEYTWRSHWTTHTSKTINIIYLPTTLHDVTIVTTAAAHLYSR
jgi:hypothetical protein